MTMTFRSAAFGVLLSVSAVAYAQDPACTSCHQEQVLSGTHAVGVSCESCHGDGRQHIANPASADILTFRHEPPETRAAPCIACHQDSHAADAQAHRRAGRSCNDCHTVHDNAAPDSARASAGQRSFDGLDSASVAFFTVDPDVCALWFERRRSFPRAAAPNTSPGPDVAVNRALARSIKVTPTAVFGRVATNDSIKKSPSSP